jgi:hypothetical protein
MRRTPEFTLRTTVPPLRIQGGSSAAPIRREETR